MQDKVPTTSITKRIENEDGEMGLSLGACAHANSWKCLHRQEGCWEWEADR